MPRIEFERVSKTYSRHARGFFWKYLLEAGRRREPFYALRDVSFRIEAGESVGIVGSNGAGKTTILNLAAGLTGPEQGTVNVDGRLVALLELGSGFHPDLTGRENITINAALLGYSRRRVDTLRERIMEYSGIGGFIDEPLRTYSQGMVLRLAFAVAVHADPDILLVDELLAVGDQEFQRKSFDHLVAMKRAGKILLCVSHAAPLLEQLCDRLLWVHGGRLVMEGASHEVMAAYRSGALPVSAG